MIVKVNGDIVTQSEFEARQVAAVQAARIGPERIETFLRENNARILQEAIDELLVVQRAAELGMRMPPAYLKDVIENIKKENNIASEEDFQSQLRREGMTLDDLKRNIERQIVRRQVLSRELESKVTVTETEARAEYEAKRADYTVRPTVKLHEILVKDADDQAAMARARELVKRARDGGEDFATLARENSASPTRLSGGEIGTLSKGEMNAEIQNVAFALAPGEVSEPFRVGEGEVRILRVAEKSEGRVIPFEEVKADILKRLTQERWQKEYDQYVEGLRKTAMIDVRVREVPLQVDVPTQPTTLLEPPADDPIPAAPAAPAAPASGAAGAAPSVEDGPAPEFTTTPQSRPERVVPNAPPGAEPPPVPPASRPSPSPSPTPPPN